ncbi:hypothetical protein [Gloeothece verrucosa]|uniref:Uncharacterized protein n=1 Tax=Gloeothece verrucosa (strain PCC 7822) TaxID=497965 RepID=E0U9D0_GLOV7|nr:hypothetical protein [Gloeothece verrucosa]ADN12622.1 conserved hypothetical protein [Gloeothece verrucosa PCC 7822]
MSNFNTQVHLLADNAGTPGQVITNPNFQIGDRFFIEVLMKDSDPSPVGLISSAINVNFNPAIIHSLDSFSAPIALNNSLVTQSFPMFRTGTLDSLNGSIINLGGGSFPAIGMGSVIGINQLDRFSLMHFETLAGGNSNLEVNVDLSQTGFADGSIANSNNQNQFTQNIVVLSENPPPSVPESTPTVGLLLIGILMALKIFGFPRQNKNHDPG